MPMIMPRSLLVLCLLAPAALADPAENLAAAVRFPTISHQQQGLLDTEAFLGLHQFLRQTYPRVFSQLRVEVINDYSLLIIWDGTDNSRKPVLFTSHIDVVPVEPGTESGWTHPAFAGVIADGNIYGRGTLDDKVGVISLLEAAERLLAAGYQPQRTLVFGFGHDEEVGGRQGAGMIAQRMRELGLYFEWMVDEGSFIVADNPMIKDRPVALIGVAEKTFLTLKLTATGPGGHSSMPPPHTAAGRLAAAVARVEDNPFPPRLVTPVKAMLEGVAPYAEFPTNLVLSNLWLTSSLVASQMTQDRTTNSFVRTTTAVTILRAGVKDNVIPQTAEAFINFRLLPGDTPEMVIDTVTELIDDPEITVVASREFLSAAAPMASMSGGGYAAIEQAVAPHYPTAPVLPYMMSATTDIRHYVELADNHYRFHGALINMSQGGGIHGTDEYVSVDSFRAAVDIAEQLLQAADQ
jgi:carboxypeptidase PM20D1